MERPTDSYRLLLGCRFLLTTHTARAPGPRCGAGAQRLAAALVAAGDARPDGGAGGRRAKL